MFFAELIVPFLIFTPRLPRRLAFFGIAVFQVTLLLTGNYGFFNTLTIVVCLPLLEDSIWPKFLRRNPGVSAWIVVADDLRSAGRGGFADRHVL